MGIVGSKDEYGKVILGKMPPGFLDAKGRDLRDRLDECLNENMWYFTIGEPDVGLAVNCRYKNAHQCSK